MTFPLIYLYVNIYMFYQLYIYDYVDHALKTFRLIEKINPKVSQILFNNDIEAVIENISAQIENKQIFIIEEESENEPSESEEETSNEEEEDIENKQKSD